MANTHHGTGLVIKGIGILIRGPSGAGKSLLALALLDRAAHLSVSASLVADDQVGLREDGDSLIMTCPPLLSGKIELRGYGILDMPCVSSARLHLVIDLVPELIRMPEAGEFSVELIGRRFERVPVPKAGVIETFHQLMLIEAALRRARLDTEK